MLDCTGGGETVCVAEESGCGGGGLDGRFSQHTDTKTVHELHIPEEGYCRQESCVQCSACVHLSYFHTCRHWQ